MALFYALPTPCWPGGARDDCLSSRQPFTLLVLVPSSYATTSMCGRKMPSHSAQERPTLRVPNILPNELAAFHEAHFSTASVDGFQQDFIPLHPQSASYYDQNGEFSEDEDDLGYYEDGVKRTLTDEQIEIFRHSELREVERARERAVKAPKLGNSSEEPETPGQPRSISVSKPREGKKGKKRPNKQAKREPKPDLRKRTWDVVEAGLDSLDYD